MLLNVPSGLHIFTLFRVPVYVSGWFLLILAYWVASSGLESGLIWAGAIFVSLIVHEFGHALVAKYFRLAPSVQLHGLGGLCAHQQAARDRDDALIIAAGPGAGLLFGLLVWLGSQFVPFSAPRQAHMLISNLLYINIIWSFANLLPLYPLDGGQLFRLGIVRLLGPVRGEKVTHITGMVLGIGIALAAYYLMRSHFLAFLAGYLAFQNYQIYSSGSGSGPYRRTHKAAKADIKAAENALKEKNYQEAARLAHAVRADIQMPEPELLQRIFTVLGLSAVRLEQYQEAKSYLKRINRPKGELFAAAVVTALEIEDSSWAKELLAHSEAKKLPEVHRHDLQQLAER